MMTTAHLLPPHQEPVSQIIHSQFERGPQAKIRPSFIPENNNRRWLLAQAPVDFDELSRIREQSRLLWSKRDTSLTTYQHQHAKKDLDEPTRLRQTSAHRRNRPHPPILFLTTRLHNCSGFNNADADIGKATYQVDGSVEADVQQARQQLRVKFHNRPDSQIIRQNLEPKTDRPDSSSAKLELKYGNLGQWDDETDPDFIHVNNSMTNWQTDAKPSLYRHLKYQGPGEAHNIVTYGPFQTTNARYGSCLRPKTSVTRTIYKPDYEIKTIRHPHTSYPRDKHPQDLIYQPTRTRGDYAIHPKWPPTLPHHNVP